MAVHFVLLFVVMYLFCNCGNSVSRKRGKMYDRTDFNDRFFSNNDFVFYNKFNEGVCVINHTVLRFNL